MPLKVDHLKKAALLGVKLGMQIDKTFADGFKIPELMDFIDEVLLIPEVIDNSDALAEEVATLDHEGAEELNDYVAVQLQLLRNVELEAVIEQGVRVITEIIVLVKLTRGLIKS